MENEDNIKAIVEKVVSTLNDNKSAEKPQPQPESVANDKDKVVIDLQKSYEKLSGQLDEINRKLTEKQETPQPVAKKPLII